MASEDEQFLGSLSAKVLKSEVLRELWPVEGQKKWAILLFVDVDAFSLENDRATMNLHLFLLIGILDEGEVIFAIVREDSIQALSYGCPSRLAGK